MKGGLPAGSLFDNIMEAPWFGETVKLFFGNERPRPIFDQAIEELIKKGRRDRRRGPPLRRYRGLTGPLRPESQGPKSKRPGRP